MEQKEEIAAGPDDLFEDFREIVERLDDLSYNMLDHPEINPLCGIIEELREWGCAASEHEWILDMCGYWQHAYCLRCGSAKYPDMVKRRCGDLDAEMGNISEEEFFSKNEKLKRLKEPVGWEENLK